MYRCFWCFEQGIWPGATCVIYVDHFPADIRLDEDVLKTSWRHLSSSCSEDVFKTSWSRRIWSPWPYVFIRRLQDAFKTSWWKPIDLSQSYVFKTFSRRLQDLFKTFSRPLQDVLQIYLQEVFKAYHQVNFFYTTRPREVFNTFLSTEEFA